MVVKNNVTFEENIAAYTEGGLFSGVDAYGDGAGGAISAGMAGGAVEIADGVVFQRNTGLRGGGVSVSDSANCSIRGNVMFEANAAFLGGGIFVSGTLLHLQQGLEVTQYREPRNRTSCSQSFQAKTLEPETLPSNPPCSKPRAVTNSLLPLKYRLQVSNSSEFHLCPKAAHVTPLCRMANPFKFASQVFGHTSLPSLS